jgi:Bacterial antitoxin of type II TA system, VapB
MKKTLHIDEKLLGEAKLASGAATDTDTVRLGLEALVRHAAYVTEGVKSFVASCCPSFLVILFCSTSLPRLVGHNSSLRNRGCSEAQ